MTTPHVPEGRYFDDLIDIQGDFNPFTERGWRTLARQFQKATRGATGLHVLDVGCGTGNSCQIYAAQAASYVGMDLSRGAVRSARGRHPDHNWLQADATALPFNDHSFDVVAFSSVLHHIPDMLAALVEARRILRRDGLVFAFDPNLLHPAMFLFRHPKSPLYNSNGVSPHEQPIQASRLRRVFAEAGLASISQRCQSDIPYRQVAPPLLNAMLPAYNMIDRLWEYSGLSRWMGTFVVTSARSPL